MVTAKTVLLRLLPASSNSRKSLKRLPGDGVPSLSCHQLSLARSGCQVDPGHAKLEQNVDKFW
ncbi:hypothetical protein, partial [Mesorhizobium sp. M2D.F.Ca.ET.223.01.1.1]|uniref:hypothetical protein n=1 Tax=Mesorhizobium sp. M2D.F.Ca.ET.223.01.1.1 TaxID=2563940 RepID=UPI001AEE130F